MSCSNYYSVCIQDHSLLHFDVSPPENQPHRKRYRTMQLHFKQQIMSCRISLKMTKFWISWLINNQKAVLSQNGLHGTGDSGNLQKAAWEKSVCNANCHLWNRSDPKWPTHYTRQVTWISTPHPGYRDWWRRLYAWNSIHQQACWAYCLFNKWNLIVLPATTET